MRMEPGFEKANEIYFRLGIIYKQQGKFRESLEVRFSATLLGLLLRRNSASNILYLIHLDLLTRKTSGFRLAMSTNSRKT